jgi:hypothetical protein
MYDKTICARAFTAICLLSLALLLGWAAPEGRADPDVWAQLEQDHYEQMAAWRAAEERLLSSRSVVVLRAGIGLREKAIASIEATLANVRALAIHSERLLERYIAQYGATSGVAPYLLGQEQTRRAIARLERERDYLRQSLTRLRVRLQALDPLPQTLEIPAGR